MAYSFTNDSVTLSSTEYFLASDSTTKVNQTDDCIIEVMVDPCAMAASNQLSFKFYEAINGQTQRTIIQGTLRGTQVNPLVYPALIVGDAWETSLLMGSGADATVGWSLRKITGGLTFTDNSASIGTTEFFLASNSTTQTPQTTDCLLQTWIDAAAMAAGDRYAIRLYEKVNGSGATQRRMWEKILDGAQTGPFVHPITFVGEGWDVGVVKLAGTDRTIHWSLRKAA